ncbi:tRNA pseudouridine(38-40) synthase TruA [Dokdonia sp. Hel_I_53]|uniref:tRNA pseudouridine(38-40) synthase TruA n=1 Tax=Dokdonia sp. Hel_I_53 TaxID=1566287 RepID=UPI00119A359E|nr:tRNA pseudouridine(38-40) synthase TruA [Dokdonia sp. Hel_I_53]TVZ50971.1 tRNA pseudouridine38-40 synthase [Dokdonia sp. Hel_I_53]
MRYFIELSYFGKKYHGWQRQPNAITVQEVIENALSTILQKQILIMGAGRTDAGVHATQMFAHFDWENENFIDFLKSKKIGKGTINDFIYKLNNLLPVDIVIKQIVEVKDEAHSRFDAISRSYIYRIVRSKNAFTTDHAYTFKHNLNIKAMNEAASVLLDYNDFECFSKSKTEVNTYLCDITEAYWEIKEDEIIFHITANRFLRNMVRAIVGTLLEIGQEKKPVEWIHHVIATKNRAYAGSSVPGKGLYLTAIKYPNTILS